MLVGHSHFFREFFRTCLASEGVAPELADFLRRRKIGNCDVARCELDFSGGGERVVRDVLIFTPAAGVALPRRRRRGMRAAKVEPGGPVAGNVHWVVGDAGAGADRQMSKDDTRHTTDPLY